MNIKKKKLLLLFFAIVLSATSWCRTLPTLMYSDTAYTIRCDSIVCDEDKFSVQVVSVDTSKGKVTGSGVYAYMSQIKITSMPKYGYHFTQWNDGDTNNPRTVTVERDSNFTAMFAPDTFQLSVFSGDTVRGNVSGNGRYTYRSLVNISANPKSGYQFVRWVNGGTNNPRLVTLLCDTSFTAIFAPNNYKLSVVSSDTVKGNVSGDGSYMYLGTAKLVATPKYGYHFTKWNDGDTTNPRLVTLLGDTSFSASFAPNNYNLAVVSSDTVKGIVSGAGSYTYLSQVKVAVTPNYGYRFTQWNDGDTSNPRIVTLLSDTSFTASFAPNNYKLSVVSSDTVKGNVSGDGSYTYLSQVKISATPNYGYHFTQWNDGDKNNPRTIILKGDTSFTATFAPNSYQLAVVSSDTVKGKVSGGGSYTYLLQVKVAATPNYGYHFTHWNDGDTTNPRDVTVECDSNFTASFAPNSYNLSVVSSDIVKGKVSGGGSYIYLSEVKITATPNYGYHFMRWNDGNTTNPRTVTLKRDTSFTAIFAPNNYNLAIVSSDTAKGKVSGGGSYNYLSHVKITATPNYGYHFTQWNDGDTTYPRTLTLKGDTSFTAFFACPKVFAAYDTICLGDGVPVSIVGIRKWLQEQIGEIRWDTSTVAGQWGGFKKINSQKDTLYIDRTMWLRATLVNVSGNVYSDSLKVTVNPLPDIPSLHGDTLIKCSNRHNFEYWVDYDSNLRYLWTIPDSSQGKILSSSDSSAVIVKWSDRFTDVVLALSVENKMTGCVNNIVYNNLYVDTINYAPQKTNIALKKGADILICEDAHPNAHYMWGMKEKATGQESILDNSDYQYIKLPKPIDTAHYYYFVEIWYGDFPCATRSYYLYDELGVIEPVKGSANLVVFPNPSHGELYFSLSKDIQGKFQIVICSILGRVVYVQNSEDYSRETIKNINAILEKGIYVFSIVSKNEVLTHKIVVL